MILGHDLGEHEQATARVRGYGLAHAQGQAALAWGDIFSCCRHQSAFWRRLPWPQQTYWSDD